MHVLLNKIYCADVFTITSVHQQKAPLAPYVSVLLFSCEAAGFISSTALCICPLAATRATFINAMPPVDYSPSYVKAFKYSSGSDFLHFLTFLAALTVLWNLLQSILCSVSEPIGLRQPGLRDNGQCFGSSGVVNNRSVGWDFLFFVSVIVHNLISCLT